jgi:hypothetical protein
MIGFADGVALNVNASRKAGAILRTVAWPFGVAGRGKTRESGSA